MIIDTSMHGLMRDRSCQTNLISCYEEVSSGLDCHESLDGIYLDFSKALDTVPHVMRLAEDVYKWVSNW